jgi:hypothetical protein
MYMNFAAFEIAIVYVCVYIYKCIYIYMTFAAIVTVYLTVTGTDLLQ